MPKANANSVAEESHGSTRSVRAEKREGLARSIRVIAILLCLGFLVVLHAGGNVASFPLQSPSRSRHCATAHSSPCRSAIAAAMGPMTRLISVSAQRILNGVPNGIGPTIAAFEAATPKISTGTVNGKTRI